MRFCSCCVVSGAEVPQGVPESMTPQSEHVMPWAAVNVVKNPTLPIRGNPGIGTATGIGPLVIGTGTDHSRVMVDCTESHACHMTGCIAVSTKSTFSAPGRV